MPIDLSDKPSWLTKFSPHGKVPVSRELGHTCKHRPFGQRIVNHTAPHTFADHSYRLLAKPSVSHFHGLALFYFLQAITYIESECIDLLTPACA